jgi:UDP-GlcNAc:undecaprenyl-phosphate/decaprenyl-phosphate GlcNAc-1-phosphate transferase
MPHHLVAFISACAVVLLSTPIVNTLGLRSGYVDLPGPRKVHQRPMVRLGGVSIFIGNLVALLLVWNLGGFGVLPPAAELQIWGVTLGGLAFFLIGLADDLFNLPPLLKLFLHFLIATLVWFVGVRVDFLEIPFLGIFKLGILSLPFTTVWLVGITNAINFLDGLDGLAAGVGGISALVMLVVSLFLHQSAAALIAAALAGGALAFLRYNFNPAKIFMGDGGAYFIGFTLAGIGVIGLVKSVTTMAVLVPFLILAVPILDTSAVVVDRLRSGQSPFTADKRHLHHRLLKAGLPHRLIVLFIYALTLWVGCLAVGVAGLPKGWLLAIGATVIMAYTSWSVWKRICAAKKQNKP